ncbi:MAG: glycoside hydrolase family 44 protein [Polyangiales bacterium]
MKVAITACLLMACAGHEQAPDTASANAQSALAGGADVVLRVDVGGTRRAISPLIYGINDHRDIMDSHPGVFTFRRFGGNRSSAYNWENNASNAGEDYHHSSDAFFGESNEPARYVLDFIARAQRDGAEALVTIPLLERVARDKNGPVAQDEIASRFVVSRSRSSGEPVTTPDSTDDVVYQDAFAARVVREHPRISFSLDNEPGSWNVTHPRIHPQRVTYAELITRSVDYARAIRRVAPNSTIYGPASFGLAGWLSLAGAPDAAGRDFIDVYLDAMARAETGGTRLLDVFDVHFYPSPDFEGQPIAQVHGDAAGDLRMQLPRSLYDDGYEEPSWIVRDVLHEPINLLPRLTRTIREHYPGTKLSITEYNYGGGGDISGAVAQADVLGAYGRHGVHAAAFWELWQQPTEFIVAAFDVFQRPGDLPPFARTSLPAESNNVEKVGVWASVDEATNRVSVVVIHRSRDSLRLRVDAGETSGVARRVVLGASSSSLQAAEDISSTNGHYDFVSRGPSVTYLSIE